MFQSIDIFKMTHFTGGFIRRLAVNRNGGIALWFALGVSLLLLASGAVVDYARQSSFHESAQDSLDASVMAAAIHYQQNQDVRKAKKHAQKAFAENCLIYICGDQLKLKFEIDPGGSVTGQYRGNAKPMIMKMFGVDKLPFQNVSQVNLGGTAIAKDLDLVMIIDTTMSMADLGDAVKNNMHDFAADLSSELTSRGSSVGNVRVKFIFFRDYSIDNYHLWTDRHMSLLPGMERYGPMFESPFFTLPVERTDLDNYVDFFAARGGGSPEESSLEALYHA